MFQQGGARPRGRSAVVRLQPPLRRHCLRNTAAAVATVTAASDATVATATAAARTVAATPVIPAAPLRAGPSTHAPTNHREAERINCIR